MTRKDTWEKVETPEDIARQKNREELSRFLHPPRPKNAKLSLWVVVFVFAGVVLKVQVFRSQDLAEKVYAKWLTNARPDYDHVSITETSI